MKFVTKANRPTLMQLTATLEMFAEATLPVPLVTVQYCVGFLGCVKTVTA